MSDVTDLAEQEAARAEAAPPDEETSEPVTELADAQDEEEEAAEAEEADAEQTEGVPAEPEGLSQKELEARMKRLDKSSAVWRERVATIMESDVEILAPCPMCEPIIPGFVMLSERTPERFPAVREFMGDAQPAEYKQDPNTRTCQTCAGEGMVATGSKVDGQAQLVCTDCGGKGWQGARPSVVAAAPTGPMAIPDANGQDTPTPQGPEPPEAAKLRALGYTLIQPVGT